MDLQLQSDTGGVRLCAASWLTVAILLLVSLAGPARTQAQPKSPEPGKPGQSETAEAAGAASLTQAIEPVGESTELPGGDAQDSLHRTHDTLRIGGKTLGYTATAGTLPLRSDSGEKTADVFFIAYTQDGVEQLDERPVTFCFNGGPGSSSVWLHMGLLGPQRIQLPDDPVMPRPPHTIVPNESSLLDVSDLVFIDPVSTGYSRPVEQDEKDQFHGYDEDIRAVGEFIHLYTTRFHRWRSPRFLLGESYGCLRAAGLVEHLWDRYNMDCNGVVLVSSVINFQTLRFAPGNDLPYILFLPSYTATAWYHEQLPADLQQLPLTEVVERARRFALNEYTLALMHGTELSPRRLRDTARELARLTGLSPRYVLESNLRIPMGRFGKELLRRRDRTVGRFDSRYLGRDRDGVSETPDYDPSAAGVFSAFTAALYQYLHEDLGVERDDPYEILTSKVHPWSYKRFENRFVDSSAALREAMTENPHLRVFVANGYYDLATPFLATEYSFSHMLLAPSLRENVVMKYYEAGHMMYVHEPSRTQLKSDLAQFYRAACAR